LKTYDDSYTSHKYVLKILDEKPDMYLDEIAEDLSETLGLSPSLSTVQRTLKLLGYTTKKVCYPISQSVGLLTVRCSCLRLLLNVVMLAAEIFFSGSVKKLPNAWFLRTRVRSTF
jgi:hypothetical protein